MRRILRGLVICVGLYVLLIAALIPFQRSFIYHPQAPDLAQCDLSNTQNQLIRFGNERALLTKGHSGRIVVFYHGNSDMACGWRYLARHFGQRGDAVLVLEYPSYARGDQSGTPPLTQERLFDTVRATAQWIKAQGYSQTLVVGYSLGSAAASHHARIADVERVMLYAPFDRLINVIWENGILVPRALLWDDYDNIKALQAADVPVMILHRAYDFTVRQARSKALAAALGDKLVRYYDVPLSGHGALSGEVFEQSVRDFLNPSAF